MNKIKFKEIENEGDEGKYRIKKIIFFRVSLFNPLIQIPCAFRKREKKEVIIYYKFPAVPLTTT